jgi:hypothetical protein
MLRTHRSLKAYCATPVVKMSSFFYQVLQLMEHQWNEIDRGKPTTRRKTCPSATLFTTNLTWTWPGIFFLPVRGFPLWSIFVLFKSFRPSYHFTFHITVLTTNTTQTSMPPVGFEPTIPVSERPQTHVLDRAATGIGSNLSLRGERPATNRLSHGTALIGGW